MSIVKWLNGQNVLISNKLADSMAAFEFHQCGTVEELAGDLVRELVLFTKDIVNDGDRLYGEGDKAAAIMRLIGEDSAPQALQAAIDRVEDDLHPVQINDEIDGLMCEVVACAVQAFDLSEV